MATSISLSHLSRSPWFHFWAAPSCGSCFFDHLWLGGVCGLDESARAAFHHSRTDCLIVECPGVHAGCRAGCLVRGIIAFAALANIAGYLWDFYEQFWWFDDVLHAYTTFSITLPLALLLYGDVLRGAHAHSILLILVITSLGLDIGVFWEVAEWAYDQMVPENAILGKRDTIIDLILEPITAGTKSSPDRFKPIDFGKQVL